MEKSISMGSVAERLLDYIDTAMQHDTNYEIATTLVKNYSKLSELSIGEIADMCFVSKASVSRFCRFMGFADFKDLRNQLEHDVLKTGLFPHAFVEQLSNDTEGALASYREAILLNIETTISAANIAKLPAIVDDLHDSGHVAFFSHHFLWDVGRYFQSRLTIMNRPIELYLDYSSQLACAQSLTKSSLAIICSIGGNIPHSLSRNRQRTRRLRLSSSRHHTKHLKRLLEPCLLHTELRSDQQHRHGQVRCACRHRLDSHGIPEALWSRFRYCRVISSDHRRSAGQAVFSNHVLIPEEAVLPETSALLRIGFRAIDIQKAVALSEPLMT